MTPHEEDTARQALNELKSLIPNPKKERAHKLIEQVDALLLDALLKEETALEILDVSAETFRGMVSTPNPTIPTYNKSGQKVNPPCSDARYRYSDLVSVNDDSST